eukprot:6173764-Pleurochrysis_carterae.AAC.2
MGASKGATAHIVTAQGGQSEVKLVRRPHQTVRAPCARAAAATTAGPVLFIRLAFAGCDSQPSTCAPIGRERAKERGDTGATSVKASSCCCAATWGAWTMPHNR